MTRRPSPPSIPIEVVEVEIPRLSETATEDGPLFIGPAPRRPEPASLDLRASARRSARVTAVRVAVVTGQYVIDKHAVAENLVDQEVVTKLK